MPPVQELAGSFSRQQVAWTLSLVHSRSFAQAGRHVWVPGIDMANHTLAPNATIRFRKPVGRRGRALRNRGGGGGGPGLEWTTQRWGRMGISRGGRQWGGGGSALRSWLGRMPGLPISKLQRRGALLGGCTAA